MRIQKNTVASFHYTLTDETGQVLDSSEGEKPFSYLHGHEQIIPGLEAALEGKAAGDAFEVELTPEEAYGEHDPELVERVPRAAFQGVETIEPGMMFQAQTPDGEMQVVRVVKVEEDHVIVDGNHPLAGRRLHFKVQVVDVREATEDEIAHGHVHG
ncbi:MAG: peptidylprolyl isomerase [Zetaproteobacteria bacterium]|nr:MAG: peptidylprolyl isomerase [Zetaproteobacteria bacterium]